MYIKVVTVKTKPKGKRVKVAYKYVRIIDRYYSTVSYRHKEKVIATLGDLHHVLQSVPVLIKGLQNLQND